MKKGFSQLFAISIAVLLLIGTANAASISVDPTDSFDPLGSTSVSFDVFFDTEAGENFSFVSMLFYVTYDITELGNPVAVNAFDPTGSFNPPFVDDPSPGDIRYLNLDFGGGVPFAENTSTLLLTVDFSILDPSTIQDGLSDFFITSPVEFNDSELFTVAAQGADVGAPVPIPGAFLLLGSGLIGLAGLRRKLS